MVYLIVFLPLLGSIVAGFWGEDLVINLAYI